MAIRANSRGRASWGKTYRGFSQALVESGKTMTKQGATIMTNACEEWLQEQDSQWPRGRRGIAQGGGKTQRSYGSYSSGFKGGDTYHPWYTGNLHDSMATIITDGHRVVSIRQMEPGATIGQTDNGYGHIDGTEWGLRVANRAAHVMLPGIQGRLVIGVPYAEKVNEMDTHAGYVEEFERDFASTITDRFNQIRNLVVRLK